MTPRSHAAEILKLKNRGERQERLKQVPEEWQALVRKHVEVAYDRQKN